MINKLRRALRYLKKEGFRAFFIEVLRRIFPVPTYRERMKNRVLNKLLAEYKGVVAYGPFKGMQLSESVWWGKYDLITKMLGEYEADVLRRIYDVLHREKNVFIDIGAADGYYAIGVAFARLSETVYAFEISEDGREQLRFNASRNSCLEKIHIEGEADYSSLKNIVQNNKTGLVLIDIEGSEYDLLNDDILALMSGYKFIIELHPFLLADGSIKEKELLQRAEKYFKISNIYREAYSPNKFKELNLFPDDVRLLAFSEGRRNSPAWLYLEPLSPERC